MSSECNDILTELESWYARENGEYLLAKTRLALQELLDTTTPFSEWESAINSALNPFGASVAVGVRRGGC